MNALLLIALSSAQPASPIEPAWYSPHALLPALVARGTTCWARPETLSGRAWVSGDLTDTEGGHHEDVRRASQTRKLSAREEMVFRADTLAAWSRAGHDDATDALVGLTDTKLQQFWYPGMVQRDLATSGGERVRAAVKAVIPQALRPFLVHGLEQSTWCDDLVALTGPYLDEHAVCLVTTRKAGRESLDLLIELAEKGNTDSVDARAGNPHSESAWKKLTDPDCDYPRYTGSAYTTAAVDQDAGLLVVYVPPFDTRPPQTWTYDPATNVWKDMQPAVQPHGVPGAGLAYDPFQKVLLLHGGKKATQFGGPVDAITWRYDVRTNTWTDLKAANGPGNPWVGAMDFDPEYNSPCCSASRTSGCVRTAASRCPPAPRRRFRPSGREGKRRGSMLRPRGRKGDGRHRIRSARGNRPRSPCDAMSGSKVLQLPARGRTRSRRRSPVLAGRPVVPVEFADAHDPLSGLRVAAGSRGGRHDPVPGVRLGRQDSAPRAGC